MSDQITKNDVQEIVGKAVGEAVTELAGIISDLATNMDRRFEQVDKRFENLEGRVGSLESGMHETNVRLSTIEHQLDSIDDRLKALENDIHDIYLMLASKQDKNPIKKLKGKSLEQYVIETYNNLIQIAKEEGIKLPR